jgi:MoaA/NifB/PqqE/SkfB family radical SAM enzyme
MTITEGETVASSAIPGLLWLDLTRKCQLTCAHCYNESGPQGDHGTMTRDDWLRVLDQAADLGMANLQFIGGEPTLHPDFEHLVQSALDTGLEIEVFSNLVHVSASRWKLFLRPGVTLATSYYSDQAGEHDAMTGRRSHARTRANIAKAVRLGIPLRAGIIVGSQEQRADDARRELELLGVTRIGVDNVRPFGRGAGGRTPDMANLCGQCGTSGAAIGPTGEVAPCVFSGWMGVGNVKDAPLAAILGGAAMEEANIPIRREAGRGSLGPERKCDPRKCSPDQCYPDKSPCYPARTPCVPNGSVPPPCKPNSGECTPGFPSDPCGPGR